LYCFKDGHVKEAPYSGTLVICRLHILKPLLDTQNRRGYLTVVLFTNQELHMLLFTRLLTVLLLHLETTATPDI